MVVTMTIASSSKATGEPLSEATRQPVLELKGVTAGYGDLAAVRDVSLALHAGEVVALFGPNGAGKTTTLMAAGGVLPRRGGPVLGRGEPSPRRLHMVCRAGLAYVP